VVKHSDVIVFDMDGVLVDVSESYRSAIIETVRHFTGQTVTKARIQDYKNQGGWNNDWALSQKICADLGFAVEFATVVREFNRFFFGENGEPGLMARERWIARPGFLQTLQQRFDCAIFTGREREEAHITLRKYANDLTFAPLVGAEDVARAKPAPDGLLLLGKRFPGRTLWYVGDTVDDARSAQAAGIAFIGIAGHEHPGRAELIRLLEAHGAVAVLEDIHGLPEVLPQ
jgi:HAD superfamily phosphatase